MHLLVIFRTRALKNHMSILCCMMMLCLASQPEVEKQLRLVEYSARYAVGLFFDKEPWKDIDWGMKFYDDPVIRFISFNGGRTVTGIKFSTVVVKLSVIIELCLYFILGVAYSWVFRLVFLLTVS